MVGRADPTPRGHSGRDLDLRGTQECGGKILWGLAWPLKAQSENLGVNSGEEGLPCSPPQYWKSLEIISQLLKVQRRRLRPEGVKGGLGLHRWVKASSGSDPLGQGFPLGCFPFHLTEVSLPRKSSQLPAGGTWSAGHLCRPSTQHRASCS